MQIRPADRNIYVNPQNKYDQWSGDILFDIL